MANLTSALFTAVIVTVTGAAGQAGQQETPPVRLQAISINLYEVIDGQGARGGAYIGDNGVVLIDAKMDKKSVDATIAEIRKLTNKPIRYMINTHSDGDHVRGNQYLPEGIPIIAHDNCRSEFFHPNRDGSPSEWTKPELASFVPGITYRERMDLYLGAKNIQLWYFGVGHTTGDTVVYFPEEKTAFLGDQVFATRPQLIHSYKGGSAIQHVKTVQRILDTLNAERFCTGHDASMNRAALQAHIARMLEKQSRIAASLKTGKDLESIKGEFPEEEARLVEAFYQELRKTGSR